jgi:hypothetical protein
VFKLNYNNNGNLVSDEGSDIALPSREWELLHDNVMLNKTIVVRTSTGGTGITITDFTTQVGSKPWKTKLVFGGTVSAGRYYITYYSQGDQNDADDLNTLAGSVNALVQTVGPFSGIQTELDAIQQSINKVESEVNITSALQKSIDAVQSTVNAIPTVQTSILNAISVLKTDMDSTIAKEQTLSNSIAGLQLSITDVENVQTTIISTLNQLSNKVQTLIDMGGIGGGTPTNTAPNISSSFNVVNALTTDSISIPYTVYDAEGGTLVATYNKDGVITTANVSTGSNSWNIGALSAGNHTLSIWVKDSGNLISNTLTFNISVTLVNTAPTITSSYSTTTVNDRALVSIPYTVTDAEGGVLTATYTKDGVSSTATISTGSNTWDVGTLSIGNHTLSVIVKDNGNLMSNQLTFNISVIASNTAPGVNSAFNTTSVAGGTFISIPYSISDAEDSSFVVTYTIDSSSTTATVSGGSNTWNVGILAAGSHTLSIQAKDSGNLTSNTLTFNISVGVTADTTPPQPVSSLSVSGTTSSSVTVGWQASPSGDVANYKVAYSSDGGANYVTASSLVNSSSTTYTVTGLTASTNYIIKVTAIDTSGNESIATTVPATTAVPTPTNVDGGTFTNNTVTSSSDGGTFTNNTVTDSMDGGTFTTPTDVVDGGIFGDTTTNTVDGGTFTDPVTTVIDGGIF